MHDAYRINTTTISVMQEFYGRRSSYITSLETPKRDRNKGQARRLLRLVCDIADEEDLELQLVCCPDEDEWEDRLEAFYRSFGFAPGTSPFSAALMVRPRISERDLLRMPRI